MYLRCWSDWAKRHTEHTEMRHVGFAEFRTKKRSPTQLRLGRLRCFRCLQKRLGFRFQMIVSSCPKFLVSCCCCCCFMPPSLSLSLSLFVLRHFKVQHRRLSVCLFFLFVCLFVCLFYSPFSLMLFQVCIRTACVAPAKTLPMVF